MAIDPLRLKPAFKVGYSEGQEDMRNKALQFLQDKYIKDEDRPDRDSPEARYLLNMARQLSAHLNDRVVKNEVQPDSTAGDSDEA